MATGVYRDLSDALVPLRLWPDDVTTMRRRVSLISRGRLDDISQAKLEECLRALGHDIEISISQRHEGTGEVRVRELA